MAKTLDVYLHRELVGHLIQNDGGRSPIPESYWEPLRAKAARMEQQWLQAHAANP